MSLCAPSEAGTAAAARASARGIQTKSDRMTGDVLRLVRVPVESLAEGCRGELSRAACIYTACTHTPRDGCDGVDGVAFDGSGRVRFGFEERRARIVAG